MAISDINEYAHLTDADVAALGEELDALKRRIETDLGERDVRYLRRTIMAQRGLEAAGRLALFGSGRKSLWLAGTAALALAKIIENMELGHNVMHGQWDWMNDPEIHSTTWEWDMVCASPHWKHSHNYIHHKYTNVIGMDHDVGYKILRVTRDEPWEPRRAFQPFFNVMLATTFEWGIALHDLELKEVIAGRKSKEVAIPEVKLFLRKAGRQMGKDYLLFPALTGPLFPLTFLGNATANLIRNVWAFNIIFCGHFPAGVATFSEEDCLDVDGPNGREESHGHWYYRQLLGSANIDGGRLLHLMSGNLSHQIEHHLFPDIPARRYPEIAVEIREICERYDLPYNTGPLHKQLFSVAKKICRLALPPRRSAPRTPEPVVEPVLAA